ncbi:hypothetical protein HQ531_00860 [bacterium]|nr:hypothetical protein [bacterium]
MTIIRTTRFIPETPLELKKYTKIIIDHGYSPGLQKAGFLINYRVDYYSYSQSKSISDHSITILASECNKQVTLLDLNKLQFEYAVSRFSRQIKDYFHISNKTLQLQLGQKILYLGKAIIDLRNWFIKYDIIPDCFDSVGQYFINYTEPEINNFDSFINIGNETDIVDASSSNFRLQKGGKGFYYGSVLYSMSQSNDYKLSNLQYNIVKILYNQSNHTLPAKRLYDKLSDIVDRDKNGTKTPKKRRQVRSIFMKSRRAPVVQLFGSLITQPKSQWFALQF